LTKEDPVSIEDPPFRNKIYKNKLKEKVKTSFGT
jgi:hypothetical protein